MARALLGQVGGTELRLYDEVRRLRRRVQDLESEVGHLQAERDVLAAAVREHHVGPVREDLAELGGLTVARSALLG